MIGAYVHDILPDELYQLTKEKSAIAFQTNDIVSYEYSIILKGKDQWFDARMIPISDNELVIIVRNITDKKESERAILESELKHRKLISNISDVIVVIDKNGDVAYKSENIKQYFGWDAKDLLGKDALLVVHDDDRERISEEVKNLLKNNGKKTTQEFKYICQDGSIKPVELTGISLINDPLVNGIIANYRDISERKEAERAVVETQRLGAIGEMSSAIAHDFNNSLQSIFGNLELAMLQLDETHPAKHYLDIIKTASSDAATRVRLLQRFAGKSQSKNKYEVVNINSVIDDVIIQSRPIWKDRPEKDGNTIEIEKNLESKYDIFGNDGELRSVLYNIIKNCVEAMPQGGKIILKTHDEKDCVKVIVKDNGIGMDEKTKSRIFQPFFTTKGFETGRGLGLSGSYSIINEHGGTIKVIKSSPGEGTSIEISIPTYLDQNVDEEISSEESTKDHKPAKILWVDDNKMILNVAYEMLTNLGHKCKIAKSGYEALEIMDNENFDLILTDIGMPKMSGFELIDEIRSRQLAKTEIGIVTGWGDEISNKEMAAKGIKHILAKPFHIEKLIELLDELLKD